MPMLPSPQPADVAPQPAPSVPPVPQPTLVNPVTVGPDGGARVLVSAPTTVGQIRGLRARVTELRRQLETAREDRLAIAQRLRQGTAGGADQAGLEARIRVIDERIVRIEQDISTTEAQIGAAAPELFAAAQTPPRPPSGVSPEARAGLTAVFLIFVMMPVALAFSRLLWRRGNRLAARATAESDHRLARLETAVDAIAIEIERVSEGQRFVTRLLAESQGVPDGRGVRAAEPAPMSLPTLDLPTRTR